jgi:hypothetical protein
MEAGPLSRPLVRAAIAAVVALAVVAAVILFVVNAEDSNPPLAVTPSATATPAPTSTATPTPTTTATPEPTATPRPGPEPATGELPPALELDDGAWVRQPLEAGEQPDADHGVLIVDPATGAGEHWRLAYDLTATNVDSFAYGVTGNGRLVTLGFPHIPTRVVDRESATAVIWDPEQLHLLAASEDGRILLREDRAIDGVCLLWAVDLTSEAPAPLLRFGLELADRCTGVAAAFGPPGSDALLLLAGDPTLPTTGAAYDVDLTAATVTHIADSVPIGGFVPIEGGVAWTLASGSPGKDLPLRLTASRYDWSTGALLSAGFEATASGAPIGPALVSPDGGLVAWQERFRLGGDLGLGGWLEWPIVVVADLESGQIIGRVARAALTTVDDATAWLADSTALVVSVEGAFSLLAIDRGAIEPALSLSPLPFEHVDHFAPLPDPSPVDPDVFAYAGRFVDAAGTDVYPPLDATWPRATVRGDWTSGGSEYWIGSLEIGGTDFGPGPLAPLGLAPRVELPPFPDAVRLVATAPTELHADSAASSDVTGTLEAGATVTVDNDGTQQCLYDFGCATRIDREFDDPRPWWIFVRTLDGRAGWADAAALTWPH